MRTSEQINELAGALAKAQGEFTSPERNREVKVATKAGGEYRFWYSTLDCVMDMARPILAKHGLSVTQPPTVRDGAVIVLTKLMHSSGQFQEEEIAVTPESFGPQQIGSAVTYMKRYAYCGMLGIASDEDDDGNAASGHQIQESRTKQPKPDCPACGKPDHVYEDRQKGGFFCWKSKGGCGHNWLPGDWLPDDEQPPAEPPKTNGKKSEAKKVADQHGMKTADELADSDWVKAIKQRLDGIDAAAPDAAGRLTKAENYIYEQHKAKAITDAEKHKLDFIVAEVQKEIDGHKALDKQAAGAAA